MPEDYYDEEVAPEAEGSSPEASQRGAAEGGETALIPKSLLAGKEFQPGDDVILKIVSVYEDELEVQYPTYNDEEESEPTPMEEAESEMDEMAMSGEEGGY